MGKGDKFLELENYFKSRSEELITLTLEDIERILKFSLCASAYKFEAYWYIGETHTFPNAWINSGYKLDKLDLTGKIASFIKVKENDVEDTIILNSNSENMGNSRVTVLSEDKVAIDFTIEKVKKYYEEINVVENARYKSWEHCYSYFNENRAKSLDDSVIDTLSLHLAFYLASWGMYRGSSFLLQKDYKVHHEAVLEILKDKYNPLWNIKCEEIIKEENLELLFTVTKELEKIYVKKRHDIDRRTEVSDILLTKILMGTFGCVPAYDRFFISGIKEYKVASGNYNKKSVGSLAEFYLNNRDQFEATRIELSKGDVEYPQMKLLDMCFWQIGYDNSILAEKKIEDEI